MPAPPPPPSSNALFTGDGVETSFSGTLDDCVLPSPPPTFTFVWDTDTYTGIASGRDANGLVILQAIYGASDEYTASGTLDLETGAVTLEFDAAAPPDDLTDISFSYMPCPDPDVHLDMHEIVKRAFNPTGNTLRASLI